MRHSTGKPTAAQEARFVAIKESGCICCRIMGEYGVEPDIHHVTSGGKRLGHDFSFGLCKWHHVGWCREGTPSRKMAVAFGPSLHYGRKRFNAVFGTDDELIAYQNKILNFTASDAPIEAILPYHSNSKMLLSKLSKKYPT